MVKEQQRELTDEIIFWDSILKYGVDEVTNREMASKNFR